MEDLYGTDQDPYTTMDPVGALGVVNSGGMANRYEGALSDSRKRISNLEDQYSAKLGESTKIYEQQKQILDRAMERLLTKESGPSKSEIMLRLAAAMGAPTKTGRFGETMGNVAGAGAEAMQAKRVASEANKNLADKYGIEGGNVMLGSMDAQTRQLMSQMESERTRARQYETAGAGRTMPLEPGVTVTADGRYWWANEQGQLTPHTLQEYWASKTGSKEAGKFPWKTVTGPMGPGMASQLPGAPGGPPQFGAPGGMEAPEGVSSPPPGYGEAPPTRSEVPPSGPTGGVPTTPAAQRPRATAGSLVPSNEPLDPREVSSIEPLFTPFADLPIEGAMFSSVTAPAIRKSLAYAFREIPRQDTRNIPLSGPGAVQAKNMMEVDREKAKKDLAEYQTASTAANDVLKNYTHMFADLEQGFRTGKIGRAATSIEQAITGILPDSVRDTLIDEQRNSREFSFDKWALDSATRTLKMIYGARVTNIDLETAIKSAPGRDISEKASYSIMMAKADWAQEQILKGNVYSEFLSRGGSPMRFNAWYNSRVSPYYDNALRLKIQYQAAPEGSDLKKALEVKINRAGGR